MNDDTELLRCYVEHRSEPAFTALVQRHIGLVYSVALRRVGGDAHLAEDVTQKVFSALARKAATLTERASLASWLYLAAHAESAAMVRREHRRKARETEAHLMQTTLSSSESESDWAQLRTVIDSAIVELRDEDREAVVLRFFEQRSFAEIGATLRVTEEAARKRVDRALEKLRVTLARRGFTSTATALGLALAGAGTALVPVELPAKIAGHAFVDAAATTGRVTVLGLLKTLAPLVAVLAIATFFIGGQLARNNALRTEITRSGEAHRNLAALRHENTTLTRALVETADLRRLQAELPALQTALAAPVPAPPTPVSAAINLTADGRIHWDNQPVSLREFLERLVALQTQSPTASRVVISVGKGAKPEAWRYLIDEARKAQIKNFVLLLDPESKSAGWWF